MKSAESRALFDKAMGSISATVHAQPATTPAEISMKGAWLHGVSALGALGMAFISLAESFERIADAQEAQARPYTVGIGTPLVRPDSGSAP